MSAQQRSSSPFNVFVRWRPLEDGSSEAKLDQAATQHGSKQSISISSHLNPARPRTWKSGASFSDVFPENTFNSHVFESVVKPTLPEVLNGATCNFFAYGHSGSGKTHTIIGYDHQNDEHLGLCISAARALYRAIDEEVIRTRATESGGSDQSSLCLAVRVYEIRGKTAFDLLNNGGECHIREGPDGRTHVRGQTESLENGKVRVRPIVAQACWSFEELKSILFGALDKRTIGSSTIHDESSRTHAIIEFEIVNKELLDLRDAVIERESELVPVGKRATDIYIEEQSKSLIKTPEGSYILNPDRPVDQERIDAAESEKNEFEARLKQAEEDVSQVFKTTSHACLGGRYVFVDLAGSEYLDSGISKSITRPKQTTQEQIQSRQINTDLFALKEVIRARASKQSRIPFRSSPLTMILRSHFMASKGSSSMIVTVSPAEEQYAATMNTLKYGNLVGDAGGP